MLSVAKILFLPACKVLALLKLLQNVERKGYLLV